MIKKEKTFSEMSDAEFYQFEKEANKEFREFKRDLKSEFPHLYSAIKLHEKEHDERDVLMSELFSSRFADEVTRSKRGLP